MICNWQVMRNVTSPSELLCCKMDNTRPRNAYGMIRLKPSANKNVFHISLFIKRVYRALPPLLQCPRPHFKRQLTVSHSFWYHGHLGRPHTGGAPAKIAISTPLCECTNWEHTFIGIDIAELQNKKLPSNLNFHLYRTTITATIHEHLQAFLRTRICPAVLSAFASAHSAYAFAFVACAHAQYRARSVALLPGHK